jgi:hypothetical protein
VQFEGVAVAVKSTARGAVPEEGEAVAVHERAHGAETVMVPVFVQVTLSAVTVMVQVYVPADS